MATTAATSLFRIVTFVSLPFLIIGSPVPAKPDNTWSNNESLSEVLASELSSVKNMLMDLEMANKRQDDILDVMNHNLETLQSTVETMNLQTETINDSLKNYGNICKDGSPNTEKIPETAEILERLSVIMDDVKDIKNEVENPRGETNLLEIADTVATIYKDMALIHNRLRYLTDDDLVGNSRSRLNFDDIFKHKFDLFRSDSIMSDNAEDAPKDHDLKIDDLKDIGELFKVSMPKPHDYSPTLDKPDHDLKIEDLKDIGELFKVLMPKPHDYSPTLDKPDHDLKIDDLKHIGELFKVSMPKPHDYSPTMDMPGKFILDLIRYGLSNVSGASCGFKRMLQSELIYLLDLILKCSPEDNAEPDVYPFPLFKLPSPPIYKDIM